MTLKPAQWLKNLLGQNKTAESNMDLADYFTFLDGLRESGVTNMFGASPYLQEQFKLDKKEARDVLGKWMESFDSNKSVEERAKEVTSSKNKSEKESSISKEETFIELGNKYKDGDSFDKVKCISDLKESDFLEVKEDETKEDVATKFASWLENQVLNKERDKQSSKKEAQGGPTKGPIEIGKEEFTRLVNTLDKFSDISSELGVLNGQGNVTYIVTDGDKYIGIDPQGYDYARYKTSVVPSMDAAVELGKQEEWKRKDIASQKKQAEEDTEEELPTKFKEKDWERASKPKYFEFEEVEMAPTAPKSMKKLYDKINSNIRSLNNINAMVDEAKAKFKQEVAKIEEEAKKQKIEKDFEESIDKLSKMLASSGNRVVRMGKKYVGRLQPEIKPTLSTTWKLKKLLKRYDDAEEYLEKAKKGAQSLTKPADYVELLRWDRPKAESSLKEGGVQDIVGNIISALENFNQEISAIDVELAEVLAPAAEPELDVVPEAVPMAASLQELKDTLSTELDKISKQDELLSLKAELKMALDNLKDKDSSDIKKKSKQKEVTSDIERIAQDFKQFTSEQWASYIKQYIDKFSDIMGRMEPAGVDLHDSEDELAQEALNQWYDLVLPSELQQDPEIVEKAIAAARNLGYDVEKPSSVQDILEEKTKEDSEKRKEMEGGTLQEALDKAIAEENYEEAQQIKEQIDEMKDLLGGHVAATSKLSKLSAKVDQILRTVSKLEPQHVERLQDIYKKTGDQDILKLIKPYMESKEK